MASAVLLNPVSGACKVDAFKDRATTVGPVDGWPGCNVRRHWLNISRATAEKAFLPLSGNFIIHKWRQSL